MTSVKLYCITCLECAIFGNEKASICGRGLFGLAWERYNGENLNTSILAAHAKVRNTFVGCHV
jgi:hypothetical protein